VIRLSEIQGLEVVDRDGDRLGRVFDVKTEHGRPDEPPRICGYLIGRGGLARRLGIRRGSARLIPVESVDRIESRRLVVSDLPDGGV
jgi:sporulation protein YlmC with PRC-barrel domain